MLEDYYALTDEINPNPGRYVPEEDEEEVIDEPEDWELWLDGELDFPEPDRDARREAWYENGLIPPFPLF
jgi:hypothetical protein